MQKLVDILESVKFKATANRKVFTLDLKELRVPGGL